MLNPYPYTKNALKTVLIFIFLLVLKDGFCQVKPSRFIIKTDISAKVINKALKTGHVLNDNATPATVAPAISYETPQIYVLNQAITPLAPVNTGGVVPAGIYGTLSTLNNTFTDAVGVAVDATGNIYVAEWFKNQIKLINAASVATLLAGSSAGTSGLVDGQGTNAEFSFPDGIVLDNAGNLYVSDQGSVIRKITPAGLVSTFASGFNEPRGLAIDNAGNIYVADQVNDRIVKITPNGLSTTVAGSGATGFTNGSALTATFNTPLAVACDANGNLYVSDAQNGAIRKITADGQVSTFVTGLGYPRELRVDGTGNIYVNDETDRSLKRVSPAGVITKIASGLSAPIGLIMDGKGNLFIGDENAVRKVSVTGYTIDKSLPAGLTFDQTTGIISGTPTVLSPATDYIITAYNGGGSSTTVVNLAVGLTPVLKPSIITLPPVPTGAKLDASGNYDPMATSTNNETPITYTSSNPAVAIITSTGLVHVIAPGISIITASQQGDANYTAATPVQQTLIVTEYLAVDLPDIPVKTVCDIDFSAGATAGETKIPITYNSSNTSVATISDQGIIHITGIGTTTITASQNTDLPYYVSAISQSKILTVTIPVIPVVSISAVYAGPCIGSPVTFTANVTNGGANPGYQWAVNGINTGTNGKTFTSSTFADGDVVTCTCTNTDNTCISGYSAPSNQLKVSLIAPSAPTVSITASVNSAFFGEPITFTATVHNAKGTVAYQWQLNGNNVGDGTSTFTSKSLYNGDIVTCAIVPASACSAPATSNPIKIIIITQLGIPNAFTPNGDGINDTWNISGIADYPDCLVNVYNRYGILIFHSKGYGQPWDGTFNGAKVPFATYYYVINLGYQDKKVSGDITVIR